MSDALGENKLVPPEIISDRYVFYRVPEFLLAYLDCDETLPVKEPLPFEQDNQQKFFERSKIFIHSNDRFHLIANLAKGGVIKVFDKKSHHLILNDCGILGKLTNGDIVTSQWVDDSYSIKTNDHGWEIEGHLNLVPSNKLFTPFKNIIFRTILLFTGWQPKLAHFIKGRIRKSLILGQRGVAISFIRKLELGEKITITNKIIIKGNLQFASLSIGDEFFVRYVPQSRYFQSQELGIEGWNASGEEISELNKQKTFEKTFKLNN